MICKYNPIRTLEESKKFVISMVNLSKKLNVTIVNCPRNGKVIGVKEI